MRRNLAALVVVIAACNDSSSPADLRLDRGLADRASDQRGEPRPDARHDLSPDTRPPAPARWDRLADLTVPRHRHTLTVLQDGSLLAVGGYSYDPQAHGLSSAERYDAKTDTWTAVPSMSSEHFDHQAVALKDGRVLIVGGCKDSLSNVCMLGVPSERYDPKAATNPWKTVPGPTFRREHAAAALLDGRALVVGGYDSSKEHTSLEVFDPSDDSWTTLSPTLGTPRLGLTATVLKNGQVLLAGGYVGATNLDSLELFDPAIGTLKLLTATLKQARFRHSATLLQDGRVLIVGGACGKSCYPDAAELYDPATSTISSAGSYKPGEGATATLLEDGRVLVAGGNMAYSSASLYLPATSAWKTTLALTVGRQLHQAVRLGAAVIVVGGSDDQGEPLTSVAQYTP